jgi:hypothetical protein
LHTGLLTISTTYGSILVGVSINSRANRLLIIDQKILSLASQDSSFLIGYSLPANTSSIIETGIAASTIKSYKLNCEVRALSITSITANLQTRKYLYGSPSNFNITSHDLNLITNRIISLATKSISASGQSANIGRSLRMTANVATYSIDGQSMVSRIKMPAESIAFLINSSGSMFDVKMPAETGQYTTTGISNNNTIRRRIHITSNPVTINGPIVGKLKSYKLIAANDNISLNGTAAYTNISMPAEVEHIELAGNDNIMEQSVIRLRATVGTFNIQSIEADQLVGISYKRYSRGISRSTRSGSTKTYRIRGRIREVA